MKADLEKMVSDLEKSGDYRVLRRVKSLPLVKPVKQSYKIAIILDVETTGLDIPVDEIIELSMIKVIYDDKGIIGPIELFDKFLQPEQPIPEAIQKMTGITDAMVKGCEIRPAEIANFIADANLIIAHNAEFDRNMVEKYWPQFIEEHWACSATQIPWRTLGFPGVGLGSLLSEMHLFHNAHRAIDDCWALVRILSEFSDGKSYFKMLADRARQPSIIISAINAPFEMKDALKRRGYRWNSGVDGGYRCWKIEIPEADFDEEMKFLRSIYGRDVNLPVQRITALERFRIKQNYK